MKIVILIKYLRKNFIITKNNSIKRVLIKIISLNRKKREQLFILMQNLNFITDKSVNDELFIYHDINNKIK